MTHEVLSWIGRSSIPETRDVTKRLLECFAELVETQKPMVNLEMSDDEFLKHACDIGNQIQKKREEKYPNYAPKEVGIWVGFPETPIGRLNADLASMVWHLNDWLENK